jgi:radical SAM superfamily enzyme YgiQ (UPF0313 family)
MVTELEGQMAEIDIVFIQPPGWAVENPPMGLAMLKSYLSDQGLIAKVFDLNILLYNIRSKEYYNAWELANGYYTWERESWVNRFFSQYSDEILNFIYSVISQKPRYIGFSVHNSSFLTAILLAKKIRQYNPEISIMFGGPEMVRISPKWRSLLQSEIADIVVFGEGEVTVSEYLQHGGTAGLAYRNCKGEIIEGEPRNVIPDLDTLPFPDYSDFNLKLYRGTNVLPTYFSRGCVNRCIYCTEKNYFPTFRCRSGKRVFEEIKHQRSLYPKTEYFRLHDSVSNGNIRELEILCDLIIESNLEIGFDLEGAIIRKEMTAPFYKKLRKAGCTIIGFGMETPSKPILKNIGKMACLSADFDKVITDGVKSGITIGVNFMFGLPGETEEESQMQLEFIRKYKRYRKRMILNPALNYCYFPPGCTAYEHPEEYGIDISRGPLFWESKDGKNTFPIRLNRFERFCKLANELGYENLFGITESINRNEMLDLYNSGKDILSYPKETILHNKWEQTPANLDDLKTYLMSKNISDMINHLTFYIEQSYEPSAKFHLSVNGIKRVIKYNFSKWVYKNDKQYTMFIHALNLLDNKIKILGGNWK